MVDLIEIIDINKHITTLVVVVVVVVVYRLTSSEQSCVRPF